MRKDIFTAIRAMLLLTLICGIAYPLVVTGISQVAFHANANGQQLFVGGKLVGSKIIGQNFADEVYKKGKVEISEGEPVTVPDPRYFQTRPSGTDPADNDAATEFENYGPNSKITLAALQGNISTYLQLNCATTLGKANSCSHWYDPAVTGPGDVPVDAADTSASGVDPDISILNADIQAYHIATVRHQPLATVRGLISKYTYGRGLGFSGEPGVDVLELNLALNRIS
jgi:potassium-transporting ATPase KdpC subunit